MGFFDRIIDKRVTTIMANHQVNRFQGLDSEALINFINSGLPTINPDTYDYYDPYKNIGAVYEAVSLISSKVQNSPYVFYKIKDKRKSEKATRLIATGNPAKMVEGYKLKDDSQEEVHIPALEDLLLKPNPYMDGSQFMDTLAQCYLLRGNAFMYGNKVNKKAKELFVFPEMEIVTKQEEYLDPVLGYKILVDGFNQSVYEKDEIYHFKTANPTNIDRTYSYLYGVSPLRAYIEALRSLREGYKLQSKIMNSGGAFGVLSPTNKEDQFSVEQREMLKAQLVQARRSKDELARIFASSIQLSYNQIGLNPSDLELLEGIKITNEQIYKAFKIPVAYVSTDGNTYNNAETFIKRLVLDAVAPVCDSIGRGLTEFVGNAYGVQITLDYMQLPDLSGVMESLSKHLVPLVNAGIISRNEARYALGYGESEQPDMNEFTYRPQSGSVGEVGS